MKKIKNKTADKQKENWRLNRNVIIAAVIAAVLVLGGSLYYLQLLSSERDKESALAQAKKIEADRLKAIIKQKRSIITGLKFVPNLVTVQDKSVTVEVQTDSDGREKLEYSYEWMVNDKIIDGAKGNTLNIETFKNKDRISVSVTPYIDGVQGLIYVSNYKVIHGKMPSLVMEIPKTAWSGGILEIQLKVADSESEKFLFALEEPFLEGMTIDKETGKISRPLKGTGKGVFKFGASVTDADGNKVIKTFDYTLSSSESN